MISKKTTGFLTYSSNWQVVENDVAIGVEQETSGMATMIVHDNDKYHIMSSLQFGIPHTYFTFSLTRKFQKPTTKLRGILK